MTDERPTERRRNAIEASLALEWASFEQEVLGAGWPAADRQDMRRAFYSGATSLFEMIMAFSPEPGDEPTDADLDGVGALSVELVRFREELANDVTDLVRQIGAKVAGTGWQDIDTAPRDGTTIDLWVKWWRADLDQFLGRRQPDCRWFKVSGHERWTGDSPMPPNSRPTHWMPKPEPPPGALVEPDPRARGEQ